MSDQYLMTAFVRDDCVQGEFRRVCVSLERLGINDKQIEVSRNGLSILRAARTTVDMPVLDQSDEAKLPRDSSDAFASSQKLV
jgi:hypothetical protein